jgi:hypothetical protein
MWSLVRVAAALVIATYMSHEPLIDAISADDVQTAQCDFREFVVREADCIAPIGGDIEARTRDGQYYEPYDDIRMFVNGTARVITVSYFAEHMHERGVGHVVNQCSCHVDTMPTTDQDTCLHEILERYGCMAGGRYAESKGKCAAHHPCWIVDGHMREDRPDEKQTFHDIVAAIATMLMHLAAVWMALGVFS